MASRPTKRLRISELARRAEVSVPTVKHYLNQGLLPRPVKTGKTMAWYDESSVSRVRLIKKLQREKFLPLEVIKRLLDSRGPRRDELKLGKAIFKTEHLDSGSPVPASQFARRSGYPLEKIRALEAAGLLLPVDTESGKFYRLSDLRVIELIRGREELGVPFDHSLRVVKAYKDAISRAVEEDLKLFASEFLGDVPARQAARLMTEADESLDVFIVLYRHLFLRRAGEEALERLNSASSLLETLNFLPLRGAESLKTKSEADKAVALLAAGDYDGFLGFPPGSSESPWPALRVMALVLSDRGKESLEQVKKHFPEPGPLPLDNAAAALAYLHSLGRATGFSEPMFLAKRALTYLQRIEAAPGGSGAASLFARYVQGAAYVMLPDFFDTAGPGVKVLAELSSRLEGGKLKGGGVSAVFKRLFREEVLPAAEVRVHWFLARGRLRLGEVREARASLDRVIRLADPSSPLAQKARMEKAGLGF